MDGDELRDKIVETIGENSYSLAALVVDISGRKEVRDIEFFLSSVEGCLRELVSDGVLVKRKHYDGRVGDSEVGAYEAYRVVERG